MTASFALSIVLFLCFSAGLDFARQLVPTLKPWQPDLSLNGYANALLLEPELLEEIREIPQVEGVYGVSYLGQVPAASSRAGVSAVNLMAYTEGLLDSMEGSAVEGDLSAICGDSGQAATIRLWDNASAPHSNGIATPEEGMDACRPSNISVAELYVYPADAAKATGQGVIICPGGGYAVLAFDYEGYEVAQWLAAHGITAAVLKYRMPNGHPEVPLEDAEQALRLLRGEVPGAEGFTCRKVGILGFSAGGHLAAMASTMGAVRPDFSVLFYPVITAHPGHQGSFDNLVGKERRSAETDVRYSLEHRVSDDDTVVPPVSSTRYYNALKEKGVKASMHIYPTGGHGWGIGEGFRYREAWQQAVLDWLEHLREE